MEALLRASDLEDDVRHLWLDWETGPGYSQARDGLAAAGNGASDSVRLGAMRLIVDTGCGCYLVAERCV